MVNGIYRRRSYMQPASSVAGLSGLAGCGCESNNGGSSGGIDFSTVPTLVWIGLAAFGALMVLKKR
jgi:hypothetical protein